MAGPGFRNQNPAERVRKAVAGDPNEAHSCERCGSTFFIQNSAYQQTVSSYGVRVASISPQMYHSCVGCGEPLVPNNLQNMANKGGEREAFLESIELGKKYRSKHDSATLAKNTASITELEALKEEVEALGTLLCSLTELVAELESNPDPQPEQVLTDVEVANKTPEKITRRKVKNDQ
jgi:hypothetical protein